MWNTRRPPFADEYYYNNRGIAYSDSCYGGNGARECHDWRRESFGVGNHTDGDDFARWSDGNERGYGYSHEVSFLPSNPTRHHVACQTAHIAELLPLHLAWRIGGRPRGPANARGGRGRVQRTRCKTIPASRTRGGKRDEKRDDPRRESRQLTSRSGEKVRRREQRDKDRNKPRNSAKTGIRSVDEQDRYKGPSSAEYAGSMTARRDDKEERKNIESVVVKITKIGVSDRPCSAIEAGSQKVGIDDSFRVNPAQIIPPNEWPSSANKAGSRNDKHGDASTAKQVGESSMDAAQKANNVEEPTVVSTAELDPSADLLGEFDDYEFLDPPPTPGGSIQWPELF